MGSEAEIAAPGEVDLAAIAGLLTACDLPADDIAEHLAEVTVARSHGEVVACIGLELSGEVGLLRSLAVAPAWRGRGLADELCRRIVERASRAGVTHLYLLTTTAAGYFRRRGWCEVERDRVPPAIRATREFTSLCPTSAMVMVREIDGRE